MAFVDRPKRSRAEGKLPCQYDREPAEEVLTAYTGVPLLARAVRSFDVPGSVERHLHLKQRQRSFDEGIYVESFLVLNALGGGCLGDFARFREDPGLGQMLGHELPNPENLAVHVGLLGVVQRALAALAETIQEQYLRGDSACNEQTLLGWLRNRPSARGSRRGSSVLR